MKGVLYFHFALVAKKYCGNLEKEKIYFRLQVQSMTEKSQAGAWSRNYGRLMLPAHSQGHT